VKSGQASEVNREAEQIGILVRHGLKARSSMKLRRPRQDESTAPRSLIIRLRSVWLLISKRRSKPELLKELRVNEEGGISSTMNFSRGTQHLNSRVANQAKNHRPRKQGKQGS
jgi:hypothetical protein